MTDRPDVQHEIEHFREQHARVLGRVDQRVQSVTRREWLHGALQRDLGTVVRHPADVYEPPAFLSKVLPGWEVAELRDILQGARAVNDEHEGEETSDLDVLMNGDPDLLDVRARLRAWCDRYAKRRLERGHPKDGGDRVATFMRVYDELTPWFDDLAYRPGSLHTQFFGEAPDYLAWVLYQGTWARDVSVTPLGDRHYIQAQVNPKWEVYCRELLQLYSWSKANSVDLFCQRVGSSADGAAPPDHERSRRMVSDMTEMRPLLVRNYRTEKSRVQLGSDCWGAWFWSQRHLVGIVVAASSERKLIEQVGTGFSDDIAAFGFDGGLAHCELPWLRPGDDASLRVGARVLEVMHAKLFSFYEKIDLQAIVAGRASPTDSQTDEGATVLNDGEIDDARVAASCQQLALDAGGTEADPSRSRRLALRSQQMFAMLERLGCEVRQGKGSEIVVYRPGGRIMTVGHHRANAEVGWSFVRRVLRRVGIPVAEWVAVSG